MFTYQLEYDPYGLSVYSWRERDRTPISTKMGSGSLEQVGPLCIIAMKKERQTSGRSMTSDLENDNVMRTKRARHFRSVLGTLEK